MGCRFLEPDINNSSSGNHHHNNNHKADDNNPWLPPGFRFHPTDEELVVYYLKRKVMNGSFPVQAITEVDLNKCEPWDLPAKAKMGEKEWYFFSLRDRKYPTGMRTNRATDAGYWKATGKDREVTTVRTGKLVGMKKTLVFYRGRAPKGEKTNWIMHEYRIEGEPVPLIQAKPSKDEWVVCRIFQKSAGGGNPKKIPMDCNNNNSNGHQGRSASFTTDGRSSLPALLESPNPNTSVDDSDGCFIESSSFHGATTGVQDVIKSSNSSWCGLKTEMGSTLDELHHGKGGGGGGSSGSVVLPCSSYLMDLYTAAAGADVMGIAAATTPTSSSSLRIDNAGYPNLLRQNNNSSATSFNNLSASPFMSLKYLDHQSSSRGMSNLRACKAEPYAGEDDEAQSSISHRPSLINSWVGGADSAAGVHGFGGEASLRSMTNVTTGAAGMVDLDPGNDNHNAFYPGRFASSRSLSSATFIPDPSSSSNAAVAAAAAAGGELAECLWTY